MLSTSESGLKVLMSKTILFSCNFQIQPLQFRKKISELAFCATDCTVSLMVMQNKVCLLCNSLLCQKRHGQGMVRVAQCDKHKKK